MGGNTEVGYDTSYFNVANGKNKEIFDLVCESTRPRIDFDGDGRVCLSNTIMWGSCTDADDLNTPGLSDWSSDTEMNEKLLSFMGSDVDIETLAPIDVIAKTMKPGEVLTYSVWSCDLEGCEDEDDDYDEDGVRESRVFSFAINQHGKRMMLPSNYSIGYGVADDHKYFNQFYECVEKGLYNEELGRKVFGAEFSVEHYLKEQWGLTLGNWQVPIHIPSSTSLERFFD